MDQEKYQAVGFERNDEEYEKFHDEVFEKKEYDVQRDMVKVLKSIRGWVRFLGWMIILGFIVGACTALIAI